MINQPKVLVIDDEQPFLDLMTDKLSKEGFTVLTANGGQVGLEIAFKEHPDVILLDILMPKMHGWEVYEKLRQNAWGKSVPVIILTNVSNRYKEEQGKKTGEYDYCVKIEYNLGDIIKKIKEKIHLS